MTISANYLYGAQIQRLAIPETRYVNRESKPRVLGHEMMLSHGVASENGISKVAAHLILAQQDDTLSLFLVTHIIRGVSNMWDDPT
jgi:hypothetical protein